jgi:ribosomal protein S27E
MDAIVVKNTGTQTTIKCPYCSKLHRHGNGGELNIIGSIRQSHCLKVPGGQYKIK